MPPLPPTEAVEVNGAAVRDFRVHARRISSVECARLAGMSTAYLSSIEAGTKRRLSREKFDGLVAALGVSADSIRRMPGQDAA